jgi:hypothetical protein
MPFIKTALLQAHENTCANIIPKFKTMKRDYRT